MSIVDGDSGSWVIRDEKLCGVIFCRMGNGVKWAYMLPIEAVFRSISKTLGALHPDWPSPEVQIAREEVVGDANENSEIITKPEDRPKFSNSESLRPKPSELRVDKHNHENSPAASTFPEIQSTIRTYHTISGKRRGSNTFDDDVLSATTNKSNAWASKSILSLGKISRKLKIAERALLTLIRNFQMAAGCVRTLVF